MGNVSVVNVIDLLCTRRKAFLVFEIDEMKMSIIIVEVLRVIIGSSK